MPHQLIFTSAPQGLRPGTRGFTTVAATRQMSPPLVARLEALSGYALAFDLTDPKAHLNPVAYAHLRVSVGGERLTVLSRSAAAGADYSGRSNTIAHHLVLDPADRCPAGPAWVLAQPDLLVEQWAGPARYLDPPRIPRGDAAPQPCRAWEQRTGDAGWGGRLAEAFLKAPRQPAYLIYEPGEDLLPLIAESLALLPVEQRWSVSFSTYYTGPIVDTACAWRCVLAGSAAAREIARSAEATVIDLTGPLPAPPATAGTAAAREGRFCRIASPSAPAASARPPAMPTARPPRSPEVASDGRHLADPHGSVGGIYDLAGSQVGPPSLPRRAPAPQRATRRRRSLAVLGLSLLLMLLALGASLFYYLGPLPLPKLQAEAETAATLPAEGDTGGPQEADAGIPPLEDQLALTLPAETTPSGVLEATVDSLIAQNMPAQPAPPEAPADEPEPTEEQVSVPVEDVPAEEAQPPSKPFPIKPRFPADIVPQWERRVIGLKPGERVLLGSMEQLQFIPGKEKWLRVSLKERKGELDVQVPNPNSSRFQTAGLIHLVWQESQVFAVWQDAGEPLSQSSPPVRIRLFDPASEQMFVLYRKGFMKSEVIFFDPVSMESRLQESPPEGSVPARQKALQPIDRRPNVYRAGVGDVVLRVTSTGESKTEWRIRIQTLEGAQPQDALKQAQAELKDAERAFREAEAEKKEEAEKKKEEAANKVTSEYEKLQKLVKEELGGITFLDSYGVPVLEVAFKLKTSGAFLSELKE